MIRAVDTLDVIERMPMRALVGFPSIKMLLLHLPDHNP